MKLTCLRGTWHNLHYSWRQLWRQPKLTLLAGFTLATGIGLCTTQFAILNGILFQELPFEDPDRFVAVDIIDEATGQPKGSVPPGILELWQSRQQSFEGLGGAYSGTVNLFFEERVRRYEGTFISPGGLSFLGVEPLLGQLPGEANQRADPADERLGIVLGFETWQEFFNGSPHVVGRDIRVNGQASVILAVMPEGLAFPMHGTVWVFPAPGSDDPWLKGDLWPGVGGKLKEGVTPEQAAAELTRIREQALRQHQALDEGLRLFSRSLGRPVDVRLEEKYHPELGHAVVRPFAEAAISNEGLFFLWVMLAAVFFVLLIACANVANLLLARAVGRRKEMAIRGALGASRFRLVDQMLAESTMLAFVGALFGLGIAWWLTDGIQAWLTSGGNPGWFDFSIGWETVVFAAVVGQIAGFLTGVIPAWHATGQDQAQALKEASRTVTQVYLKRVTNGLVIVQLALSCALLVAGGLLVNNLLDIRDRDYGFEREGLLQARVAIFEGEVPVETDYAGFVDGALDHLRSEPWVYSATATSRLQMGSNPQLRFEHVLGDPQAAPVGGTAYIESVAPDYFETLGAEMVRGRGIEPRHAFTEPAVVVNETFAQTYFGNHDATIGRHLRLPTISEDDRWRIIGIVRDLNAGGPFQGEPVVPAIYVPFAHYPGQFVTLMVRTPGEDGGDYKASLREAMAEYAPATPLYFVETVQEAIDHQARGLIFVASGFSLFGIVAALLASVGVYGLITFSVSQRTQEVGIRMAVGADAPTIFAMFARQGLSQALVGMSVGLAVALFFAWAMGRWAGLIAFDPYHLDTYIAVLAGLCFVSAVAIAIPALQATRTQPMSALRVE